MRKLTAEEIRLISGGRPQPILWFLGANMGVLVAMGITLFTLPKVCWGLVFKTVAIGTLIGGVLDLIEG